jgi:hypothetical protein
MKRREALREAAQLVGEAFPVLVRRDDSSYEIELGVEIDGLPCMEVACLAYGPSREDEELIVQARVAGTSDEPVALFLDPPGQPPPLLDQPILVRNGTPDYRWTRPRDEWKTRIEAAVRWRWQEWFREASEVFHRAPTKWADACVLVAGMERPGRWMFGPSESRDAVLADFGLPVTGSWEPAMWTHAWIGFGRDLGRLMQTDAEAIARIEAAGSIVRLKWSRPLPTASARPYRFG